MTEDGPLRPKVALLCDDDVSRIVEQAMEILATVGVEVENEEGLALLRDASQRIEHGRAFIDAELVRRGLATAPSRITLCDRDGREAVDLHGDNVHFDPGSAALFILDPKTRRRRLATAADCARMAWVTEGCRHIAAQSTALVPSDVPEELQDRYRLFVALRHGSKPVVTGTFRKDGFPVMRAMLEAVRGDAARLRAAPLAIFDCCPTPPLRWSDLTCQALIDGARAGIPVTLVSVPMAGATAPVTLREVVLQHAAECLSGVAIHQLAAAGAPVIWGGSPAAFDMRHGTTPMGAIETMMVDVAYSQVGKRLGLPTHAYMGLSDSKLVDWQAGLETGIGAILAALSGINMVSGAGMLDLESCQSLEKLVLDDESCGMARRLVKGLSRDSAALGVELVRAAVAAGQLLGHPHTRRHYREEVWMPGKTIERRSYDDWERAGASDSFESARAEVDRIVAKGPPPGLDPGVERELRRIVEAEAARVGWDRLPDI